MTSRHDHQRIPSLATLDSSHASSCRGRGATVDRPELRVEDALHYQDTSMIAHIGALIAKGASKLSTVESVEGHGRPHFRGRRKEEVRRSQSVPFHGGKPCVVRSSRYGLRGGEDSHPGPRLLRRYRGSRGGAVVVFRKETCANFPSGVLPAFHKGVYARSICKKTEAAEKLMHDSP